MCIPIEETEGTGLTLDGGVVGRIYEVEHMDLPEATARRLESLGMTPGTGVEVLNNKSGGTVIVRLRETRFALGRGISSGIHVRLAEAPAPSREGATR